TFSFYIPNINNGEKILLKIIKVGWVIEDLSPNVLFGNDFIILYNGNIDYEIREVSLKTLNTIFPFEIKIRVKLYVCRV
ncbi:hypothetical protein QBC45DRAFT_329972, partial [Copromyces sp. CBS 386.78]